MICIAEALVRPEMRETFIVAAREHIAASRAEPGCIAYDMSESVTVPCRFVFLERYQDRAALEAHMKSAHLVAFFEAATPCLAEPPVVRAVDSDLVEWLM